MRYAGKCVRLFVYEVLHGTNTLPASFRSVPIGGATLGTFLHRRERLQSSTQLVDSSDSDGAAECREIVSAVIVYLDVLTNGDQVYSDRISCPAAIDVPLQMN